MASGPSGRRCTAAGRPAARCVAPRDLLTFREGASERARARSHPLREGAAWGTSFATVRRRSRSMSRDRDRQARFRGERRDRPDFLLATATSSLNASFTDEASGNAFATSGSSKTRFVPDRALSRCFAFTLPVSCERSYSGLRSSARLARAFFMLSLLPARHRPSGDDPHSLGSVTMTDHQRPSLARDPECQESMLRLGMVRVVERLCERVVKDRRRLLEAHAMLHEVGFGLRRIPLEDHSEKLAEGLERVRPAAPIRPLPSQASQFSRVSRRRSKARSAVTRVRP